MKIEVDEKDLVYLLRAADGDADFDQYEKGLIGSAKQTRKKIRSIISSINKQLGFEKYAYDSQFGIEENEDEGASQHGG